MEEQLNTSNQPTKDVEAYKALLQIDQQKEALKAKESYWRAYILSIIIPPIGVYYFIKYFFFRGGDPNDRRAAVISLILTVISLILNIWLLQMLFNQAVTGNSQNSNFMKELITPENQKTLQQLIQ